MRIPQMVLIGAAVLALDLLAILLLFGEAPKAAALAYQFSTLLGALGGMEALHWMATRSPWAVPASEPPREGGGLGARMRAVPWTNREWLRSALLRLLSGGVVAFLVMGLPFLVPHPHLPAWAWIPYLMLLMQVSRMAAPGVSAWFLAPLLLFSSAVPASARDRLHAGLASGLSLLALLGLYLKAGSPGLLDFVAWVAPLALNPAHHAYGLLVGGLVWWKAAWLSRWMSGD